MADEKAPAEKTPRLRELLEQLSAEKQELLKALGPARADYERLINDPRLIECRKVLKEHAPRLAAIDNELAGLARAIGARGIKVDPGVYTSEEC